MFSGIVEEVGRVREVSPWRLAIAARKALNGVKVGDSISVNGACLTVVRRTGSTFLVDLSPETLKRTNLGSLKCGQGVNLERALAVDDRLGGHIVQGHVDGTGKVMSVRVEEGQNFYTFRFSTLARLTPYIVEKGFIAVDGISLTVVKRLASSFTVVVIPYTYSNTNLSEKRVGDPVNLEVDIVAKYVESFFQGQRVARGSKGRRG
jgi:riboflavin synthase